MASLTSLMWASARGVSFGFLIVALSSAFAPTPLTPRRPTSATTGCGGIRRTFDGLSARVPAGVPTTGSLAQATSSVEDVDEDNKVLEHSSPVNDGIFTPVFDFTGEGPGEDAALEKIKSAESFERIDDAIMGGISTSSLRDVPGSPYASWSGVCRIDGGGFCGTRTLPFKEPLSTGANDGIYVDCRLVSDDEPERRIWKVTMRTDESRGEMVYQAAFDLAGAMKTKGENGWVRVVVPFDEFQLVRGPRVVVGAPKVDTTGGIYQIGLSLSKFIIGVNATELETFRPGYFDLQIQRIGFYSYAAADDNGKASATTGGVARSPETLTKDEAAKKRPAMLKILGPLLKVLFSEKAKRRKSAMKVSREKWGLSRPQSVLFATRYRINSCGIVRGLGTVVSTALADFLRTATFLVLRLCFFYPLVAVLRTAKFVKRNVLRMEVKELPKME